MPILKLFIVPLVVFFFFFSFSIPDCSAAILDNTISCIADGSCQLKDALGLLVKVYREILGLIGSVVLLMFVIGGTMLILSGGNSERVEKGKKIIIGSVIGMIIVLTSYLIIQFTLQLMGANTESWQEGTPIEANQK